SNARDKKTAREYLAAINFFVLAFDRHDFEKSVIAEFEGNYILGASIKNTLDKVSELHEVHSLHDDFDQQRIFDIHDEYIKFLGVFNTHQLKRRTLINKKGEILEQTEYDYNFDFSYLKKLRKAITIEEKQTYSNLFLTRTERKIVEKKPLQLKIGSDLLLVLPKNTYKYFKFLAKYKANKELFIHLVKTNKSIFKEFDVKIDKEKLMLKYLPRDLFDEEEQVEDPIIQKKVENNTLSKRVLVMHFLLKEAGVELRTNTNISAVARLTHLVFDIKIPNRIQDSNIYKYLSKAPNFKNDQEIKKDLQDVRTYFEDINAKEIVEKINSEIADCQ
ncbi:MAG: hypothetical protein HOG05_01290, partial [Bacteroidetes bacterium]|nr:hypothetical protein [Bacteroidota bacterium]